MQVRTPRLEALLGTLRGRLARQVWLHGIGTLIAILVAWLVFAFFADRVLRVPRPVRVAHGVALLGIALFFAWRNLIRPLLSLPSREGLAILLERHHPSARERLVSAVQFQASEKDHGSRELVERVLREAEELAGELGPESTQAAIDSRPPRSRFLLGAGALGALALASVLHPDQARIFFSRLTGSTTPWPQDTYLAIEIPLEGPGVRIERDDEEIHVRVARGTDVPILVRASGEIPDEVRLAFDVGRDLVLSPSGGGTFRTLLRSCQEDLAFFATGGDDLDGKPVVRIEVLRPPDVQDIAWEIEPPAYSRLPQETVFGQREVDVLAGSRVRVVVQPSPASATGNVLLMPSDETIPLSPAAFPEPQAADAATLEDEGPVGPRIGLAFDWVAEASTGFRVDLVDATELTNPDPGLYRIRVREDRPPEVAVLHPTRSEFEIVKGGAFALRIRAEDDFGLERVRWTITQVGSETPTRSEDFALQPIVTDGSEQATPGSLDAASAHLLLNVDDLGTDSSPVAVDQRYEIVIEAYDNRPETPGVGRTARFRARVVTPEELLRRMQDRLAQARLAAVRLFDLQREKQARIRELLQAGDDDSRGLSAESFALSSALSGQRRVAVDASSLARELATITEDVLYARADEKAAGLLDRYDARMATSQDADFDPGPWRELATAQADGSLPSGGFAGGLVSLVDLALAISEDHAQAAVLALLEAEKAAGAADVQQALMRAEALQARSLQHIDELLVRLAEWDNFQNVLSLTRDILNRQKALQERTQQFAAKK